MKNEPQQAFGYLIIEMQKGYRLHGKDKTMDKQTFQSNVLSCEDMLYRISKSICFYESDCEDAVQQAVFNAYLSLDTLRDDKYFRTWITRILINECYKLNKQKSREVTFAEYALTNEAIEDNYSFIFTEIMKLSPKIRIVIQLYYIEDYTVTEIASILHIPVGTVKSRLSSGRAMLKNILED